MHFVVKYDLEVLCFRCLEERARFTNYKFLPCQYGKKFFYKELKNITMVTQYNLFTVNKWIFTTLKSILYQRKLDF